MRGAAALVLALSVVILTSPVSAARNTGEDTPTRIPVLPAPGTILTSSSTTDGFASRETAGPDTFALYGGPDHPTEGKFQLSDGVTPDWGGSNGLPGGYGGGPDAWTPVDLTDLPVFWHVSTFNAENLNGNGAGNHAMWSGVDAGDPYGASWEHLPGYGNNWNDALIYESAPVADPSVGQTVSLDFYFHHDTEPGFDFFSVEYDSAPYGWKSVYSMDGSNKDASNAFLAPGVHFSDVAMSPIQYDGNDYGGDTGDRIRIRLRVETDGAWSDEDGLWPTTAGAVQVDDITLTTSQGNFVENFEGAGPYLFEPDKAPFAGDFAEVYPLMTTVDPCRTNTTPLIGFIDYGQIVRNGPGINDRESTDGSTSPGVQYGIPGNWVFNHDGGLSFGEVNVINEIWSPEILWDLPGSADDGPDVAGAHIRFSVWNHLPIIDGIFFVWHVRSAIAGEAYTTWQDRNFVYHGQTFGYWSNQLFDVSDLLVAGPERVQMALGGWDYASIFGFPGTTSKPSPVFDNAAFYKYRVGGPTFATRNIDLAQDGFPVSGSVDVSTQAARDALDVPFSMARDINSSWGTRIVPGDSITVDVSAAIPGTEVSDIRMIWALQTNAAFEDAIRAAPGRPEDENVVAGSAGTIWTGEVLADSSRTISGALVRDKFFFDLPDADLMYPGDVLHYYIQGTDSEGRTSTLPADISDFGNFAQQTTFSRTFTVRALPSIENALGDHPRVLVINDFGRRGGEASFTSSFQQIGYREGVDYDTYTVQGPSSQVSNGIGSGGAHGATAAQLAGYEHIFYFAGDLSSGLLSDGTNSGGNDRGNDIDVLEQWYALPGTRNGAYFGDSIVSGLVWGSAAGNGFVSSMLGVQFVSADVRDVIGGQTVPRVTRTPWGVTYFATDFMVYGGCLAINQFDHIQPLSGAEAGHWFAEPNGSPYDDPASGVASVVNPVLNGINVTVPYSMMFIRDLPSRDVGLSARTRLFAEILSLFGAGLYYSPAVDAPGAKRVELSVAPNPFNPATVVRFTAAPGSRGTVKVFNLRGELVRSLHDGEFAQQEFRWDGTDTRGASVASGVYVVRATDGKVTETTKVALVK